MSIQSPFFSQYWLSPCWGQTSSVRNDEYESVWVNISVATRLTNQELADHTPSIKGGFWKICQSNVLFCQKTDQTHGSRLDPDQIKQIRFGPTDFSNQNSRFGSIRWAGKEVWNHTRVKTSFIAFFIYSFGLNQFWGGSPFQNIFECFYFSIFFFCWFGWSTAHKSSDESIYAPSFDDIRNPDGGSAGTILSILST